jgi:general nucleoside transport system ATP-binding protein
LSTAEDLNIVKMVGITKRYPGIVANQSVNFNLKKGEIHAIVGENGAGKTTLMHILSGISHSDEGKIYIDGKSVKIQSPKDAINRGIGMVHQRPLLINRLSITENILLGYSRQKGIFANRKTDHDKIREFAVKFGFRISPEKEVWQLSVGELQRVEILKALFHNAKILIMDEPTSVLTPQEISVLMTLLRSMQEQGISIIYISHKLKEVQKLANRITVMRKGQVTGVVESAKVTVKELAILMVGMEINLGISKEPKDSGECVFLVKNLSVRNDAALTVLENVSFKIRKGEIFGLAGVSGNGQLELAETLAGLRLPQTGSIQINGEKVTKLTPKNMIKHGVGFLPENLVKTGVAGGLSVRDNAILKKNWTDVNLRRGIFKNNKAIDDFISSIVERYDIRFSSSAVKAGLLSGGNLRKLVFARELENNPHLLIACQPTRGLDVKAIKFVHKQLLKLRKENRSVFLVSDDLDEILTLSDTIGVIYEGKLIGILKNKGIDIEKIGLMIGGVDC